MPEINVVIQAFGVCLILQEFKRHQLQIRLTVNQFTTDVAFNGVDNSSTGNIHYIGFHGNFLAFYSRKCVNLTNYSINKPWPETPTETEHLVSTQNCIAALQQHPVYIFLGIICWVLNYGSQAGRRVYFVPCACCGARGSVVVIVFVGLVMSWHFITQKHHIARK